MHSDVKTLIEWGWNATLHWGWGSFVTTFHICQNCEHVWERTRENSFSGCLANLVWRKSLLFEVCLFRDTKRIINISAKRDVLLFILASTMYPPPSLLAVPPRNWLNLLCRFVLSCFHVLSIKSYRVVVYSKNLIWYSTEFEWFYKSCKFEKALFYEYFILWFCNSLFFQTHQNYQTSFCTYVQLFKWKSVEIFMEMWKHTSLTTDNRGYVLLLEWRSNKESVFFCYFQLT